jgi:CheY-like chemotaxis protein
MMFDRVVLIDDNETDNFFHRIALQKAGFEGEVLEFDRPTHGLAFLLKDQISVPTCVFLDINMPLLSGFEVAQSLTRELKPRALFKLTMLTSSNWSEDRRRAQALPLITGYLVKPLTSSQAREVLERE